MSSEKVITAIKEQIKLDAWQREMEERQDQGITVDEWCARLGISKGAYYRRLRRVREYIP